MSLFKKMHTRIPNSSRHKNHFLIDFENVSSDESKQVRGIKRNRDNILFYTNACKNIALESFDVHA